MIRGFINSKTCSDPSLIFALPFSKCGRDSDPGSHSWRFPLPLEGICLFLLFFYRKTSRSTFPSPNRVEELKQETEPRAVVLVLTNKQRPKERLNDKTTSKSHTEYRLGI